MVLRKVSRWIAPGGYVLIRGPVSNSRFSWLKERVRRLMWKPKRLPDYPLDVNWFNKRSYRHLLEGVGLEERGWLKESRNFANVLAQAPASAKTLRVEQPQEVG